MKARSSIIVLAILLAVCAVSVNAQTPVTIQNPSFETFNALNQSPGNWNEGPIPSWNSNTAAENNTYGSWQPGTTFSSYCPSSGNTVAFSNGAVLTNDLGITATANATYTLTVCVGHRPDGYAAPSSTIQLLAGTSPLCTATVQLSSIPSGTFAPQTLTCAAGAAPSGDLIISLTGLVNGNAQQSVFDAVSLTVNTQHSIVTNWQASLTPNVTYNVYRAQGNSCTNFIQIASGLNVLTYTDSTVVFPNVYCYKVKAFDGTAESDAISVGIAVQ